MYNFIPQPFPRQVPIYNITCLYVLIYEIIIALSDLKVSIILLVVVINFIAHKERISKGKKNHHKKLSPYYFMKIGTLKLYTIKIVMLSLLIKIYISFILQ